MKVLITGVAGFIGYHLSNRLIREGHEIVGIDNINDYYDIELKKDRLNELEASNKQRTNLKQSNYTFYKIDICNKEKLENIFEQKFDIIIHLAAQAGIRYSIENPQAYIDSNVQGFMNILELCRKNKPQHLIYASSSSVYGLNHKMPFSIQDSTEHPISLYAATKKSNEMMAHTYSHLFGIPCSGLRFFTVYGPWGRPDMAYFGFTKKIFSGQEIDVYNNGNLMRDFTYIDDIVEGIVQLLDKAPKPNPEFDNLNPVPSESSAPYRIYNIGNHTPVKLMDFIEILENKIGKKAIKNYKPMQPGDVYSTYADVSSLTQVTGFEPKTNITEGLSKFVDWYKEYYKF